MKKTILFLFALFIVINLYSQSEETDGLGWQFGFNFGYHFANKHTANFFNGSSSNENTISYVIDNPYWYNDIYNAVNASDTVILDQLPTEMKYDPGINFGLYIKYNITKMAGVFVQFNYTKLETKDVFTLDIDPPDYLIIGTNSRPYSIWGKAERINIDIGYSRLFEIGEKTMIFFETGLNINNTDVEESKIKIEDLEFSLINIYANQNYTPNTAMNENKIEQGGIGIGFFAGTGFKLKLNESISIDPGINIYYQKINIENYNDFRLSYYLFVRLCFRNLLSGGY